MNTNGTKTKVEIPTVLTLVQWLVLPEISGTINLHSRSARVCKGQDTFPDCESFGKLLTPRAKKLDMNDSGSLLEGQLARYSMCGVLTHKDDSNKRENEHDLEHNMSDTRTRIGTSSPMLTLPCLWLCCEPSLENRASHAFAWRCLRSRRLLIYEESLAKSYNDGGIFTTEV